MKTGCTLYLMLTSLFLSNSLKAEQSCEALYYGYQQIKPDMAKAYKCFEAEGDYAMQMIMLYNGEGVARDLKKAIQIGKANDKSDDSRFSSILETIEEELKSGKKTGPKKKLSYCEDILISNMEVDLQAYCDEIRDQLEHAATYKKHTEFSARLSDTQKKMLAKVEDARERLGQSQGELMEFQYRQGTIRIHMIRITMLSVKSRYLGFNVSHLTGTGLPEFSESDWAEADRQLNQGYRALLKENEQSELEMAETPDEKKQAKADIKEFNSLAKRMQLDWIKLRDLYSDFAVALFPKQNPGVVKRSIKTLLSRERAQEFKQLDGMNS